MIPPSQREYSNPDDLDGVQELRNALKHLAGGALSTQCRGWGGDVYLPPSWLHQIHCHVRDLEGTALHADRLTHEITECQALVAIANRLDLNVDELLEAEPEGELRVLYRALWKLKKYSP